MEHGPFIDDLPIKKMLLSCGLLWVSPQKRGLNDYSSSKHVQTNMCLNLIVFCIVGLIYSGVQVRSLREDMFWSQSLCCFRIANPGKQNIPLFE